MGAEAELEAVVHERVTAVKAKDSATLAGRLAADLVSFDVLPPLRSEGGEAVEARTREWFDSYASDIGYEVRELRVVADGDVGFCSFVYVVTGTLRSGDVIDGMWPAPPSVVGGSTGDG